MGVPDFTVFYSPEACALKRRDAESGDFLLLPGSRTSPGSDFGVCVISLRKTRDRGVPAAIVVPWLCICASRERPAASYPLKRVISTTSRRDEASPSARSHA